ncbi:MAG: C1 family peptidase [bacterium]
MKSPRALLVVFVVSLVFPLGMRPARADRLELRSVEQSIQRSGARWMPAENRITRLRPDERRAYLGLKKAPSPPKILLSPRRQATGFPARVDWRDRDGENWVTPVKDQGACGSCWAFAAVAALESTIAIGSGNPTLALDLSEQFLLSCSPGGCDGYWIGPTLSFLRTVGTVDEPCFPYKASDSTPCSQRCSDWSDRIIQIASWTSLPNSVDSIRAAINQSVVIAGFDVYADFYYYSGGVYEHVWGELEGGHAVALVGYDDVEHAWIAKNSWGAAWGDGGFFKILWGDSGIGSDGAMLQYSNPCDDDADGFEDPTCGGTDCGDTDYRIHPGAAEICDGKDSDCDGQVPAAEADADADGWPLCADCDDRLATANPEAVEVCGDGIDEDCSGKADDRDADGDGHVDIACGGADCDDQNPDVHPGAPEICDNLDSNCDGIVPGDETDLDADTWMPCAGDCNDANPAVHPGTPEVCGNGLDDDCDNQKDDRDSECPAAGWGPASPANSGPGAASGHRPARQWMAGSYLILFLIPIFPKALQSYLRRRRRGPV